MTRKIKMPIITGCALGLLVFIAFYYSDFRNFNSTIDKFFYREYAIIAGKYQSVTGTYRDSFVDYAEVIQFVPHSTPFVIVTLGRTDNGFISNELIMPDLRYKYKTKDVNTGLLSYHREFIRPTKVTDPDVIYKYAYLRSLFDGKPPGGYIQQDSYTTIVNFPNLKSKFFDIKDITSDKLLNKSNFSSHYNEMSFEYYDGTNCKIEFKNRFFVIGRIYKNTVLYFFGFIILGGLFGLILKYAIRKLHL